MQTLYFALSPQLLILTLRRFHYVYARLLFKFRRLWLLVLPQETLEVVWFLGPLIIISFKPFTLSICYTRSFPLLSAGKFHTWESFNNKMLMKDQVIIHSFKSGIHSSFLFYLSREYTHFICRFLPYPIHMPFTILNRYFYHISVIVYR